MSILDFHASKLYRQINSEGFTDENGDYHPGKVMWSFCCTCNVVPAGEANKIAILTALLITIHIVYTTFL